MEFIEVFALAVALAMDALAVALATGFRMRCTTVQTLRMALAFGGFQFLMPVLGWALGVSVREHIAAFDHWIAFALLAFVGGRMVREALSGGEDADCSDPTRGMTLMILAIATSIDALAVGGSMAVLNVEIWEPALIIGTVCFAFTAAGLHVGRLVMKRGSHWGQWANALGGVVLIGIGVKILIEHDAFAAVLSA